MNSFYRTSLPKGIRANFANLKCCNPNGIPIMVIHNRQPEIADPNASQKPDTINHIIFNKNDGTPPPYTISFPNGKNASFANLKHCNPTGIPTIVIHHNTPANNHPSPDKHPPKINHSALPKHPILHPPCLPLKIGFFFHMKPMKKYILLLTLLCMLIL